MITIDLTTSKIKPKAQILVYVRNSPEIFIKLIEEFGGEDKLEQNKQFVVMFNNEPNIDEIKDYNVVVDKYRYSNRVMLTQQWIGGLSYEDGITVMEQWFEQVFGDYEWNPLYLYLK